MKRASPAFPTGITCRITPNDIFVEWSGRSSVGHRRFTLAARPYSYSDARLQIGTGLFLAAQEVENAAERYFLTKAAGSMFWMNRENSTLMKEFYDETVFRSMEILEEEIFEADLKKHAAKMILSEKSLEEGNFPLVNEIFNASANTLAETLSESSATAVIGGLEILAANTRPASVPREVSDVMAIYKSKPGGLVQMPAVVWLMLAKAGGFRTETGNTLEVEAPLEPEILETASVLYSDGKGTRGVYANVESAVKAAQKL